MKTETKTIALASIIEAPWNTRPEITEAGVKALAESIKADGLLQPLNVIAVKDGVGGNYICFDGCRRLNALRLIGVTEAPCRLWNITKAEAKIKTVTANIQREDDDPLLAAEVIGALLDDGWKPEQIASKLGKTSAWVSRRRKLLALVDPAKGLAGKVTIDALERIAALPPKAQEKVVKAAKGYAKSGMMVNANDLRWAIQQQQRDLDDAAFDTAKCAACVNRTGAQSDLFGETDGKLGKCLDCKCFDKCYKEWENAKIAEATQGAEEVVRVQYSYQMPDYAKSARPSKNNPCAYVFVYGNEVTVKFGPSKAKMDAEREKREAELAENRRAEQEVRERKNGIVAKFSDYFGADENRAEVAKAIKSCIAKPTKAQLAWLVELVADNWGDQWDGDAVAELLRVFPFTRGLCGIGQDDAKWLCDRAAKSGDGE